MFDFSQLAKTGEAVVEFINQANTRMSAMEAVLFNIQAELAAHRGAVEPLIAQVERIELAHKEIMGWLADIESSEVVEAVAAVEAAVASAEVSAALADTAATQAVAAAAEVVAEVPAEPAPEIPPAEPAAAEPPHLEEVPIPPIEPPSERKRKFVGLF